MPVPDFELRELSLDVLPVQTVAEEPALATALAELLRYDPPQEAA